MEFTTRSDALEQSCPACEAESGKKCVGARGKQRESVHRERLSAAARVLGHAPTRTVEIERAVMVDPDGNVVGQLSGVFDVQMEGERGEPTEGGVGEAGVDVPSESLENPPTGGVGETADGQLFDHDPVKEVHDHFKATVPGKGNSQLTQETRKLIKRALDERPIDQLKLAINGLALSQHHLDGGWTAIKYAIGKTKVSETVGDRIDMMAAKAPKQSPSGQITVDELLRTVPTDRHWIIRDHMANVIQAIRRGETATELEERLRRYPGIEPIREADEFAGWRKVS